MKVIYMVMNIHIYGTFEKESQWKGASLSSGRNHTDYIYLYMYMNQGYHPRREIRRRIEWGGLFELKLKPWPCSGPAHC